MTEQTPPGDSPLNEQVFAETLRYLKAMAHASRLRILGILAGGEYSVRDLADLLELKEPTISHHLSIMAEAELVQMQPYGTSHLYRLNQATLERLSRELLSPERVAALQPETTEDTFTRKTLRAFVDGERLLKIPDQRKKRRVILEWLLERFERDTDYHELTINQLIRRHHEDAATLRRELVAEGLMQRSGDTYRRV